MSATVSFFLIGIAGLIAGIAIGIVVMTYLQARQRDTFAALSREALKDNSSLFLQTADQTLRARQEAIEDLLKPVRETLDKVQAQVVRADRDREGSFQAVKQQLTTLAGGQEQLRQSTEVLSRSMRSPNVRGKWGEIQLKRIVELAGMIEHCDFEEQELGGESRLRPDLTIRLPGNTRIVVDSKVPIDAYLRAVDATSDETRNRFLDEHAAQVKSHVRTLAAKKYWEQFDGPSPELAVMFLPLEPLLSAAFERDAELLEFAATQNIVLATPMTLLALLRAVAYGWQQQSLARNAAEIREVGKQLCDRLLTMLEHFDGVGDSLEKAVQSFNKAASSFDARVMPSARRLDELKLPNAEKLSAPEPRAVTIKAFRERNLLDDDSDRLI
jgi:DNA recombination protein RmuC